MEVNPPEQGIHNWRNSLIHMGTITLGLLIAIGLEQSVEIVHRRYLRAEARQSLQEELDRNSDIANRDLEKPVKLRNSQQSWLPIWIEHRRSPSALRAMPSPRLTEKHG